MTAFHETPRMSGETEQNAAGANLQKLLALAERCERGSCMRDMFGFDRVPVITLWQPYASLCFVGDPELRKCNETRGYPPPLKYVGRRIVLHAAAQFPARHISSELNDLAYDAFGCGYNYFLPRGAILGTVELGEPYCATDLVRQRLREEERAAGDYSDGRWVWPLLNPRKLPSPLPAKGKQGWWSIDAATLREAA